MAGAAGPGAVVLRRFARERAPALLQAIADVASQSPFRQMVTPGGYTMSVAMTNCGALGWTTDRHGYLYAPVDPVTDQTWPPMLPYFMNWRWRRPPPAATRSFPRRLFD